MKEPLFGVKQHFTVFINIIPRNSEMVNKEPIPRHQHYALHSTYTIPAIRIRKTGWKMVHTS